MSPWRADQTLSIPRNVTTNRAYSGVNNLLLWDALSERGLTVNRWLTFRQTMQLGKPAPSLKVRKHPAEDAGTLN